MNLPTLRDVYQARAAIHGIALRTPLVPAPSLSSPQREVRLKLETTQPIGAFKIRGAANAIAQLAPEQRERGVTCASTGNHGRAVAFAAQRLGIPAIICMSELVPENKLQAIRALGAEARIIGRSQDDAQVEVNRLVHEQGMAEIPPFDHFHVVAGQATIGIELLEDWPQVDTVITGLSGGGLLGGIALSLKTLAPDTRIIGLSMDRGAAMHESLQAGQPVAVEEFPSLADSLGGGIGLENRYTFPLIRQHLDQVRLLSEASIAATMRHLYFHENLVAEGGGAVGIAPLLEDLNLELGQRVAVIISGRNVDMHLFQRVMNGELPY